MNSDQTAAHDQTDSPHHDEKENQGLEPHANGAGHESLMVHSAGRL